MPLARGVETILHRGGNLERLFELILNRFEIERKVLKMAADFDFGSDILQLCVEGLKLNLEAGKFFLDRQMKLAIGEKERITFDALRSAMRWSLRGPTKLKRSSPRDSW